MQTFRVGTVAASSGLTVRALHHYDHIGLLSPSLRGEGGHRLYSADDVARLYRICLLRGLGFALEEIAHALDDPRWGLNAAVARHLTAVRARAAVEARLVSQLTDMASVLAASQDVSPDSLFAALEEMTMLDTTIRSTISFLVYDDLEAAHTYLVEVFGLTAGLVERSAAGVVNHAEVRAGDQLIMLHPSAPESGFRSPVGMGAATSMTVVNVDDVDAHYSQSVSRGAVIVEEPVDQVYGVREYGARDPEGQLWFFHSPLG